MARTSTKGYIRQYGSNKGATPAVGLYAIQFSFDPTQASASVGKVLPKGAIPLFAQDLDGGATGGANPTVDIGISGTTNGFANELDADDPGGFEIGGSLLGIELTAETLIFAGVGSSAATGGTVKVAIWYMMADDGSA